MTARASDSMFYPLTMCALQIVFMIMIMIMIMIIRPTVTASAVSILRQPSQTSCINSNHNISERETWPTPCSPSPDPLATYVYPSSTKILATPLLSLTSWVDEIVSAPLNGVRLRKLKTSLGPNLLGWGATSTLKPSHASVQLPCRICSLKRYEHT